MTFFLAEDVVDCASAGIAAAILSAMLRKTAAHNPAARPPLLERGLKFIRLISPLIRWRTESFNFDEYGHESIQRVGAIFVCWILRAVLAASHAHKRKKIALARS